MQRDLSFNRLYCYYGADFQTAPPAARFQSRPDYSHGAAIVVRARGCIRPKGTSQSQAFSRLVPQLRTRFDVSAREVLRKRCQRKSDCRRDYAQQNGRALVSRLELRGYDDFVDWRADVGQKSRDARALESTKGARGNFAAQSASGDLSELLRSFGTDLGRFKSLQKFYQPV